MGKKKTHEEYVEELRIKRPDIEVLEEYINTDTKIRHKCSCGNNEWFIKPNNLFRGDNCGMCNRLSIANPKLSAEWHPTLNGYLTPSDVTCGSDNKVWWICNNNSKHEWKSSIGSRNRGNGCPICSNRQTLKGYNDIWTTNPKLAKLLANPEDGYEYTQSSDKKLDWKCPDCGEIIKNKRIASVNKQGLSCSKCSDGKSYPEKFMYNVLEQLEVDFKTQFSKKWSKNIIHNNTKLSGDKFYDFYIPSINCIIETHGEHHYKKTRRLRCKSLQEEIENDMLKEELALQNGIEKYIVIDCRESTLEHIKNSILNNDKMSNLFDLSKVDWLKCHENTCSSLVKKSCDLWNSGIKNTGEISEIMKLSRSTIQNYLKQGSCIKLCNYNSEEESRLNLANNHEKSKKQIINITTTEGFNSISEASRKYDIPTSGIVCCCKNKTGYKTAGGYKWMYAEDYYKMLEEQGIQDNQENNTHSNSEIEGSNDDLIHSEVV